MSCDCQLHRDRPTNGLTNNSLLLCLILIMMMRIRNANLRNIVCICILHTIMVDYTWLIDLIDEWMAVCQSTSPSVLMSRDHNIYVLTCAMHMHTWIAMYIVNVNVIAYVIMLYWALQELLQYSTSTASAAPLWCQEIMHRMHLHVHIPTQSYEMLGGS